MRWLLLGLAATLCLAHVAHSDLEVVPALVIARKGVDGGASPSPLSSSTSTSSSSLSTSSSSSSSSPTSSSSIEDDVSLSASASTSSVTPAKKKPSKWTFGDAKKYKYLPSKGKFNGKKASGGSSGKQSSHLKVRDKDERARRRQQRGRGEDGRSGTGSRRDRSSYSKDDDWRPSERSSAASSQKQQTPDPKAMTKKIMSSVLGSLQADK
ncbi:Uncharacterized protein PBTT_08300 [Plasmodiophora brassicae]